jgi:hypothetical protein
MLDKSERFGLLDLLLDNMGTCSIITTSMHYWNITSVASKERIKFQMKPLLIKLGLVTDEVFDDLQQQALIETLQRTYCGISHHATVLGRKPSER